MSNLLLAPRTEPTLKFGYLGVPYDASTSIANPGARFGPRALREQFQLLLAKRVVDGLVVDMDRGERVDLNAVQVADFGDVDISFYDHEKAIHQVTAAVRQVIDSGFIPLVVGGDHGVTYPSFHALHETTRGNLGLVQLDAHCDMLDFSEKQGAISGSSGMARSLELGRLKGKNMVQVGLRGYATPQQWGVGVKYGVRRILAPAFAEMGARAAAQKTLKWASAGTAKIYLTVDVDALNPGEAPGTGWPEPGGLTVQELLDFVRYLAPYVDALDIAELNPPYDNAPKQTTVMCARLLFDFITTKARAQKSPPQTTVKRRKK
ncbi:MAG: arginase family protein [Chloroflexi bacterium]|nr:arginase family protein [Chloroflexota bacterium]